MIRKLLATTALASIIATGAVAQNTTTNPDAGISVFNRSGSVEMSVSVNGYFEADSTDVLASTLIGKPIYSSAADDADEIGDVNDVLIGSDGNAKAILVGVGGFLGIGEKEVAVDFDRVTQVDKDGELRLVVSTTADELKNAPAFDRAVLDDGHDMSAGSTMDNDTMVNNNDTMASGDTTMTDDTMAKSMDIRLPEGQNAVDYQTLTANDVLGAHVMDGKGEDMGTVSDAILSDDGATIEAYIVDIGGFLGLGAKPVALSADAVKVGQDADGSLSIHTALTKEALEQAPAYSEQDYATDPEMVLVR